jgi:hypothetical protein
LIGVLIMKNSGQDRLIVDGNRWSEELLYSPTLESVIHIAGKMTSPQTMYEAGSTGGVRTLELTATIQKIYSEHAMK